jgi:hypothetical protein
MQKLKCKITDVLQLHEGHKEKAKITKGNFLSSFPKIISGEETIRIVVILWILKYSFVPGGAGEKEVV